MKTTSQKILTGLSLLSVLAVLEPLTGNSDWAIFLSFLPFLAFSRLKSDERFRQNRDKAARNGFVATLICITLLIVYLTTKPNYDNTVNAIQLVMVIATLTFAASYTYYDKNGE